MGRKAKVKQQQGPVERAIALHEKGFKAAAEEIAYIKRDAAERIQKIHERLARRRVLYNALKRGELKA